LLKAEAQWWFLYATSCLAEISELDIEENAKNSLDEMGMEEQDWNRVIRAGYELLGVQTYFKRV